jgi:pimeloyl-ACP methyl ester carboxylesterase
MRDDGLCDYLGRIDEQVKVKGYRIEPKGVAALLRQIPGVEDVVVLPRSARFGTKEIVAFLRGNEPIPVHALRLEACAILPDYMMPAHFVWVDDFPVTSNGKIDAAKLLEQLPAYNIIDFEGTPLDVEATLLSVLSIFRRCSRRGDVDADTPLHDLVDSLAMIGVLLDVEAELGVELSPLEIEQPITARNIALYLGRPRSANPDNHEVFFVTQPWNLTPIPGSFGGAMAGGRPWTQLNFRALNPFNTSSSVEEMVEVLQAQLPPPAVERPVFLIGHSIGGVLVFELARRLEAINYPVAGVVLLDSELVAKRNPIGVVKEIATPKRLFRAIRKRLQKKTNRDQVFGDALEILCRYEAGPLRAPLLNVQCLLVQHSAVYKVLRPWKKLAKGPFKHVILHCDHDQVIGDPVWVKQVAAAIAAFRSRLSEGESAGFAQ